MSAHAWHSPRKSLVCRITQRANEAAGLRQLVLSHLGQSELSRNVRFSDSHSSERMAVSKLMHNDAANVSYQQGDVDSGQHAMCPSCSKYREVWKVLSRSPKNIKESTLNVESDSAANQH